MISETVLNRIAEALSTDGYIILDSVMPDNLLAALDAEARSLTGEKYKVAGIGREQAAQHNATVRNDETCWIDNMHPAGSVYLEWMEQLRLELNRRLFLGMFDYECHYAHYAPGAYYKRHLDAFHGSANRIVTTLLYLNKEWQKDDRGELVMYTPDGEAILEKISPEYGRVVIFLSDKFPHEVLPAGRDRYSIAGWFRVNNSSSTRIDPA